MRPIADCLAGVLHAFAGRAPTGIRVRRDSTLHPVKFKPMAKSEVWRIRREAVEFDRRTKFGDGKHGGAIGHVGLRVLEALLSFYNCKTGQLDPSYSGIAARANCCLRTVGNVLRRLKELGILTWQRRCRSERQNGRVVLQQDTNAYAMLPQTYWKGCAAPPPQPRLPVPPPYCWGQPLRMPDILEAVDLAPTPLEKLRVMETAPLNPLEAALASLLRGIIAKQDLREGCAAKLGRGDAST